MSATVNVISVMSINGKLHPESHWISSCWVIPGVFAGPAANLWVGAVRFCLWEVSGYEPISFTVRVGSVLSPAQRQRRLTQG